MQHHPIVAYSIACHSVSYEIFDRIQLYVFAIEVTKWLASLDYIKYKEKYDS